MFQLIRAIPPELLSQTLSFSSFSGEEVDVAFEHSFSLVSKEKHPAIAAAKVMIFLHTGDFDAAKLELERCRAAGLSFNSDLSSVEKRLFNQQREVLIRDGK